MPKSLPTRPNLEQLKNQAKDLVKALQSGEPAALQRARENRPGWSKALEPQLREAALGDAQIVIAREYGFDSWPRLKHEIDRLTADQTTDPLPLFKQAFGNDDATAFGKLLDQFPHM